MLLHVKVMVHSGLLQLAACDVHWPRQITAGPSGDTWPAPASMWLQHPRAVLIEVEAMWNELGAQYPFSRKDF